MNVLDMLNAPWAIQPAMLTEMCAIYAGHRNGEARDIKAIEAAIGKPLNNTQRPYEVQDGVALIPIDGVLSKRAGLFQQISGGMSYTSLQDDLAQALSDPLVTSIILTIDSPGGSVDGVESAGNAIYAARSQKPIAAYVDGNACSAAYWLGSAASQMFIGSDTDSVGSIGVVMTHLDTSASDTLRGLKYTALAAGQYKTTGSSHKPLSGQDFGTIQDQLDQLYGQFVDTVARNRNTDAQTVADKMADGRVFLGQKAIDAGLVDGKMTLPALVQRMKSVSGASSGGAQPQPQPKGYIAMAEVELTKAAYDAALATAKQSGVDAGLIQGRAEGATTERERIQSIEKVALPGHEALIAGLKFDGKTTAPEAAVKVLAAEHELRGKELEKMRAGAPKPVPASAGSAEADRENANAAAAPIEIDANAVAEQARTLVAKAKAEGKHLSYAAAVAQLTAKK
jgi:signal peptide peptidase SppA